MIIEMIRYTSFTTEFHFFSSLMPVWCQAIDVDQNPKLHVDCCRVIVQHKKSKDHNTHRSLASVYFFVLFRIQRPLLCFRTANEAKKSNDELKWWFFRG